MNSSATALAAEEGPVAGFGRAVYIAGAGSRLHKGDAARVRLRRGDMFRKSADLYDRIYTRQKDYGADCRKIRELLDRRFPSARQLLDVACGTGEHARILRELFGYEVDGVDLDENLVALARSKNPDGRFEPGDMRDFHLARQYDVVLCLFSAIGYTRTVEGLTATLRCFAEHTRSGGLVIVEPWFEPGFLTPGRIFLDVAEEEDVKVARMAYTTVQDRTSETVFEYLVGTPGHIVRERETHELGLFTVEETVACFGEAGLAVKHDAEGLTGRGLYVARKQ